MAKKGNMETARKNAGADKCWDGYTAKGTKIKGGKTVPNCVKEGKSLSHFCSEAAVRSEKDIKKRNKKIAELERLMRAAKAPKAVSEVGESVTIEDADGNVVAEVIDLIKPEPMTGWRQQVADGLSEESKDWMQKAVKRPGAFTKKAEAAGMGVQEYAKSVLANKDEHDERTIKQANLARTFDKEAKDVNEVLDLKKPQ